MENNKSSVEPLYSILYSAGIFIINIATIYFITNYLLDSFGINFKITVVETVLIKILINHTFLKRNLNGK